MSKVTCIDVSQWQTNVDFKKVKNSGIEAVILRSGYGRETSQKDTEFEKNYANAKKAGLKIGTYWYSYANGVSDAKTEANACLACIKGKKFDLPVYFDIEDASQIALGKSTLTKMSIAFCNIIKKAGYKPGVYANYNWFTNYLDYNKLKKSYSIWLAQYNSSYGLDCDIWQNASDGKISGVSGNTDTNVIINRNILNNNKSNKKVKNTSTITKKKVSKPDVIYKVYTNKRWLPEVKNASTYAGLKGSVICNIAIKFTTGKCKYRVMVNGKWLPYVTGYNTKDSKNGYAGNGKPIQAIEIIYKNPNNSKKTYKAKYRVSPVNFSYYPWQCNNEKDKKQDGYAGCKGHIIDRLQIKLV